MKILVLGATGGTGGHLIAQALEAGHEVTAVVRNHSRLERTDARLTVVEGDVMDPAVLSPLVADREAAISALGTRDLGPTTVHQDGVASLIKAMEKAGTRRLLVMSNAGMTSDGDGPLTRFLVKPIVSRILRHPWADTAVMEDRVRASDLDWTIVRPPRLTDGPRTGTYRTAIDRNVRGGSSVSRADVADCVLRAAANPDAVRTAISLAT